MHQQSSLANLAELDCWCASTILDMLELKLLEPVIQISIGCLTYRVTDSVDLPLAFRMEVNTADCSLNLIEADVVKSLKASP